MNPVTVIAQCEKHASHLVYVFCPYCEQDKLELRISELESALRDAEGIIEENEVTRHYRRHHGPEKEVCMCNAKMSPACVDDGSMAVISRKDLDALRAEVERLTAEIKSLKQELEADLDTMKRISLERDGYYHKAANACAERDAALAVIEDVKVSARALRVLAFDLPCDLTGVFRSADELCDILGAGRK